MMPIVGLALGSVMLVAVADGVPKLNVEPSCRAAVKEAITPNRDLKSCMTDEMAARDHLATIWAEYSVADKSHCTQLAAIGSSSYIELAVCLQHTKELREHKDAERSGARPGAQGASDDWRARYR